MTERAILDQEVIAAWHATQAEHALRWRYAIRGLAVLAVLLVVPGLIRLVPFVSYLGPATLLFGVTALITGLLVNSKRVCPACGRVPNGSVLRVQFQPRDICVHCHHWLVAPVRG